MRIHPQLWGEQSDAEFTLEHGIRNFFQESADQLQAILYMMSMPEGKDSICCPILLLDSLCIFVLVSSLFFHSFIFILFYVPQVVLGYSVVHL